MTSRATRIDALRELVRAGGLRTQSEAAEVLSGRGLDVTQATVSRDLAALGARKDASGCYELPEDAALASALAREVAGTRIALNQVVLFTSPGSAGAVAAAIDAARPDGVIATIAGDDTVLAICADEPAAEKFHARVRA